MFGTLAIVYLVAGLIFGVAFFARGYREIDPSAYGAGLLVRILLVPASVLLWPLLARKWMKGAGE